MAGSKQKKRITDMTADEVSVVDEGANLKKFHIIKNKNGDASMDGIEDILKTVGVEALANPEQARAEIKKALGEDASDDVVSAVMGAMALMKSAQDSMSSGMMLFADEDGKSISIRKSSSMIEKSKSEGELKTAKSELETIKKSKTDLETSHIEALTAKDTEFKERISKALEVVSADDKDKLEKALNGNVTIVDLSPEMKVLLKSANDRAEAAEKIAKDTQKEINKSKFIEKSKILKNIAGTEDEKAELLEKCADKLDGEDFNQLDTLLKAANAQIEKGALFGEAGSTAESVSDGDKAAKVTALAKSKIASNPGMTVAKAESLVVAENPELYS